MVSDGPTPQRSFSSPSSARATGKPCSCSALTRILRLVPRLHIAFRTRHAQKVAVLRLPAEIWDIIASYLPATSATCLALSNRIIFRHLGQAHWLDLKRFDRRHEWLEVLAFLDPYIFYGLLNYDGNTGQFVPYQTPTCRTRCLPSSPCQALSHYDGRGPRFWYARPWSTGALLDRANVLLPPAYWNNLSFFHVRLIMNLYRNSSDGYLPLDAMNHMWTAGDWRYHTQFFVHCGRLVAKMEMLQDISPDMYEERYARLLQNKDLPDLLDIYCARPWMRRMGLQACSVDLIQTCKCAFSHYHTATKDTAACSSCGAWQFCQTCYTAYQVALEPLRTDSEQPATHVSPRTPSRFTLRVTRFSDFGEGKTPNSVEWRRAACHRSEGPEAQAPVDVPWMKPCYREQDVLEAFIERSLYEKSG